MEKLVEAEQKRMKVYDDQKGHEERVLDLLCAGYDTTFLHKQGYQSDVKWMLHDTRKAITDMMDVKRPGGCDYRAMTDLMGILYYAEVRAWEDRASIKSITQYILSEWSNRWAERKQKDGQPSEGNIMYESNFTNLLKILSHESCRVDRARSEIQQMFQKLGVSTPHCGV